MYKFYVLVKIWKIEQLLDDYIFHYGNISIQTYMTNIYTFWRTEKQENDKPFAEFQISRILENETLGLRNYTLLDL